MLRISVIQPELAWEDPQKNRDYFSGKFAALSAKTDLVILPEMFTTGFTMNAESLAEDPDGETVNWLKSAASTHSFAITGSAIIKENGNYFNRLFFVLPDGQIFHYDKKHLFSLAGEQKYYSPGSNKLIVDYRGWRICPLICYDLRFPVFARNTENYDLLIFVANWPESRIVAWNALLKARAIENMSYVVGVNRIGKDGNEHPYSGHSQVLDMLGNYLIEPFTAEDVKIVSISKKDLDDQRQKLGFLDDRDSFTLN